MKEKKFIEALGFQPKENVQEIFHKKYSLSGNYSIEVNFEKKIIDNRIECLPRSFFTF